MAEALQKHLLQAAEAAESQVDAEIQRLDRMNEDDIEDLRRRRMEALKKAQQQKQTWLSNGHGQYDELADEKEFFEACKKSKNVVCHFYRKSTPRCDIVDKHLSLLAVKHVETRFVKLDAERAPFLAERLRIVVIPTICLAKDTKTVDYVVGFDDLGGRDDFSTDMLEWRIARADVISYQGDLMTPPGAETAAPKKAGPMSMRVTKNIRGQADAGDSNDEDDW